MTEKEKNEIRSLYKQGVSRTNIAKQFKYCYTTIANLTEDVVIAPRKKAPGAELPAKLWREWEEVCEPFRKLAWAKKGGRKLKA